MGVVAKGACEMLAKMISFNLVLELHFENLFLTCWSIDQ